MFGLSISMSGGLGLGVGFGEPIGGPHTPRLQRVLREWASEDGGDMRFGEGARPGRLFGPTRRSERRFGWNVMVSYHEAGDPINDIGVLIELEDLHHLSVSLRSSRYDHAQPLVSAYGQNAFAFESSTFTPLAFAVYKNKANAVAYFLELGTEVNMRDRAGKSTLGLACTRGCPTIARLLVSKGAKLDLANKADVASLDAAFNRGHTKFLEIVFSDDGVKFEGEGCAKGCRWLRQACEMSSLTLVKRLLDFGLDVNSKLDSPAQNGGVTVLTRACELGDVAIVQELVRRGAKVDLRNPSGKTAIMHACDQDDCDVSTGVLKAIQLLLDRGAKVDARSRDGLTALMLASHRGQTWTARCLLASGATPDLQNNAGFSALMLASERGLTWMVWCLLNAGASIDLQNAAGSTALMLAAAHNHGEVVDMLLGSGAQVDLQDKVGQTALICACAAPTNQSDRALASIVELLTNSGANLNIQDAGGATALVRASERRGSMTVRELLVHGAKVDLQTNDGQTALMRCCDYANADAYSALSSAAKAKNMLAFKAQEIARRRIVFDLLDHGAHVALQDTQGFSALMLACRDVVEERANGTITHRDISRVRRQGHDDGARAIIVSELLRRGANPDLRDRLGCSALLHAVSHGQKEAVQLLIAHGAAQNVRDNHGSTALMSAATCRPESLALPVLFWLHAADGGASLNLQDSNGMTALMLAAEGNNIGAVRSLTSVDAAMDVQDYDGMTALMWAVRSNAEKIFKYLLKNGANADLQAKDGSTALMEAAARGSAACIRCVRHTRAHRETQRHDGSTALMLAVKSSSNPAVEELCGYPDDASLQDADGMTAFMLAAAAGNDRMACLLVPLDDEVNVQSKDGSTPLMLTAQFLSQNLVKKLLEISTIDLDVQRKDGLTALMLACARRHPIIVGLIVRRGANLNLRDARGRTALNIVAGHASAQSIAMCLVERGAELDFSHISSPAARAALPLVCCRGFCEALELLASGEVHSGRRWRLGGPRAPQRHPVRGDPHLYLQTTAQAVGVVEASSDASQGGARSSRGPSDLGGPGRPLGGQLG